MNKIEKTGKKKLQRYFDEARSYQQVLLMCGYKRSTGKLTEDLKRYVSEWGIDLTKFEEKTYRRGKRYDKSEVLRDGTKASHKTVLRFYKNSEIVPYTCEICGQGPTWNGNPLNLFLNHKDGNRRNASVENLRWICPNCMSQLDNFSVRLDDKK